MQLIAQRNERSSGELSRFLAKQVGESHNGSGALSALGHRGRGREKGGDLHRGKGAR